MKYGKYTWNLWFMRAGLSNTGCSCMFTQSWGQTWWNHHPIMKASDHRVDDQLFINITMCKLRRIEEKKKRIWKVFIHECSVLLVCWGSSTGSQCLILPCRKASYLRHLGRWTQHSQWKAVWEVAETFLLLAPQ